MAQTFDGDGVALDGALDDYSGKVVTTKAMGEGAIEGVASDYKLPRDSPFSADFKCGPTIAIDVKWNPSPLNGVATVFLCKCVRVKLVRLQSSLARLCYGCAPSRRCLQLPHNPPVLASRYARFDALMAPPRDLSKLTGVRRQVGHMPLPAVGTEGDDAVPAAHATVV